jgi:hypothetical protein
MPRPRPLYVEQQNTRHGRKVWYFRRSRNEPRHRLPDAYGSEEFMAAYRACLAGEPLAVPGRRRAARGAVKWLVDLYRASPAWAELKPATRKARDGVLNHLVAKVGDGDVEDLTREEIERNMSAKTEAAQGLLRDKPGTSIPSPHFWVRERGRKMERSQSLNLLLGVDEKTK